MMSCVQALKEPKQTSLPKALLRIVRAFQICECLEKDYALKLLSGSLMEEKGKR